MEHRHKEEKKKNFLRNRNNVAMKINNEKLAN